MENQISKSFQWPFSGYKSCSAYLQIERRTTTATAATAKPRQRQLSTTTAAATTS